VSANAFNVSGSCVRELQHTRFRIDPRTHAINDVDQPMRCGKMFGGSFRFSRFANPASDCDRCGELSVVPDVETLTDNTKTANWLRVHFVGSSV
jgi:hypothetical protein